MNTNWSEIYLPMATTFGVFTTSKRIPGRAPISRITYQKSNGSCCTNTGSYANRVGVLELRDDYEVQRQVARNSVKKLVGFYWGWLLGWSVDIGDDLLRRCKKDQVGTSTARGHIPRERFLPEDQSDLTGRHLCSCMAAKVITSTYSEPTRRSESNSGGYY